MPPTDTLNTRWGQNLSAKRRAAGLTVDALAGQVDRSRSQLYKIEAGLTRPSDALRVRLAAALGTTVADLFPYEDVAA